MKISPTVLYYSERTASIERYTSWVSRFTGPFDRSRIVRLNKEPKGKKKLIYTMPD